MSKGLGKTQQKILLLLSGWVALGLTRNTFQHYRILREMKKQWHKINNFSVDRAIQGLYKSKLIKIQENNDGTTTIILTDSGQKKALTYNIDDMQIKKTKRWNGKWQLVSFDIPENKKRLREIFRFRLKNLGFCEFQKSVWIIPYQCKNELEFLIEIYNARKYVRLIESKKIDNELHFKKIFGLIK